MSGKSLAHQSVGCKFSGVRAWRMRHDTRGRRERGGEKNGGTLHQSIGRHARDRYLLYSSAAAQYSPTHKRFLLLLAGVEGLAQTHN